MQAAGGGSNDAKALKEGPAVRPEGEAGWRHSTRKRKFVQLEWYYEMRN